MISIKTIFYLIAPFLDGRFKLKWVLGSELSESAKERILITVKPLYSEHQRERPKFVH